MHIRKKHTYNEHKIYREIIKLAAAVIVIAAMSFSFDSLSVCVKAETVSASDSVVSTGISSSDSAILGTKGNASIYYVNQETGYQVMIEDSALLLSEAQKNELATRMQLITDYCNVAFASTDVNSGTAARYAQKKRTELFGNKDATLFLIDMATRTIYIDNGGYPSRVITNSYCDTITDNVYTYASNSDYYNCAIEAFSEEYILLKGGKISQPMKYISNALIALILAMILNYLFIRQFRHSKMPSRSELVQSSFIKRDVYDYRKKCTSTKRVYSPQSSGSSGGSSGGGGGGGGHSGGGHSF